MRTRVSIDSLAGKAMRLDVRKRPGLEDEDVLGEAEGDAPGSGAFIISLPSPPPLVLPFHPTDRHTENQCHPQDARRQISTTPPACSLGGMVCCWALRARASAWSPPLRRRCAMLAGPQERGFHMQGRLPFSQQSHRHARLQSIPAPVSQRLSAWPPSCQMASLKRSPHARTWRRIACWW